MKNYDQSVKINHNPNWPYIPDSRYRILIIGGSRSRYWQNQRPDIDKKKFIRLKICSNQSITCLLMEEKILQNSKGFIDYSQTIGELFLRGRKLNIPLVFISQSCFKLPKTIRLNAAHYFIMKIPDKREL